MSSENPRLILGLMLLGPKPPTDPRGSTTTEEFGKILDVWKAHGEDELDTARTYLNRQQERATREAGWKKRGLKLATKVKYAEGGDNKYQQVLDSVETSLQDLGTDRVDILYLHAPDRQTPFTETLSAIDKLYREGKFVQFGLSNFTAYEVAEIVLTCEKNGWIRPTVYQIVYNLLQRSIEDDLIPACRRYGIEVVVYSPLAGGLLSGKIRSLDQVPDSVKNGTGKRAKLYREGVFKALEEIRSEAEKHATNLLEVALRWVVYHSALKGKYHDGVILGASSRAQVEKNLEAIDKGPLPAELAQAVDEISANLDLPRELRRYWHHELEYGYDTKENLFGAKP